MIGMPVEEIKTNQQQLRWATAKRRNDTVVTISTGLT